MTVVPRRLLLAVGVLATSSALAADAYINDRAAVPDAATQAAIRETIHEIYEKDFLATATASAKASLAEKLLDARSKSANLNERYVLQLEAADLAAGAGDLDRALGLYDELDAVYQSDGLSQKASLLWKTSRTIKSAESRAEILRCTGLLVEESLARDKWEIADKLGKFAQEVGKSGKDAAAINQAAAIGNRIQEARKEFEPVAAALRTLEEASTDAAANLVVGQYRCFSQNRWSDGLTCLALGSDAALKELAANELIDPADAEGAMKVADGWWEQSSTQQGTAKQRLREHAADWYRKALPGLNGLAAQKAQKRVAESDGVGDETLDAKKESESGKAASSSFPPQVIFLRATYGTPKRHANVTAKLVHAKVTKDRYVPLQVDSRAFGDPVPNVQKTLEVAYRIGSESATIRLAEGELSIIPPVPTGGVKIPEASDTFRVVAARWGAGLTWIDVTEKAVEKILNPTTKSLLIDVARDKPDPWKGVRKHLVVWFDYHGIRYVRIISDDHRAASLLP
jgi:hypothetical protein